MHRCLHTHTLQNVRTDTTSDVTCTKPRDLGHVKLSWRAVDDVNLPTVSRYTHTCHDILDEGTRPLETNYCILTAAASLDKDCSEQGHFSWSATQSL